MIVFIPAPSPGTPRGLEEAELTHGGKLLRLTVLWQIHKDGEVHYKRHTTIYLVEAGNGLVRLVKEDGEAYTVTEWNCSCPDAQFKGHERSCKHLTGCLAVGLLGEQGA